MNPKIISDYIDMLGETMNSIATAPILPPISILLAIILAYYLSKWRYGGTIDNLKEHSSLLERIIKEKDDDINKLKNKTDKVFKKRIKSDISVFLESLNEFIESGERSKASNNRNVKNENHRTLMNWSVEAFYNPLFLLRFKKSTFKLT